MVEELVNQVLNQGSDMATDFALLATTVAVGSKKYTENISDDYGQKISEYMD